MRLTNAQHQARHRAKVKRMHVGMSDEMVEHFAEFFTRELERRRQLDADAAAPAPQKDAAA